MRNRQIDTDACFSFVSINGRVANNTTRVATSHVLHRRGLRQTSVTRFPATQNTSVRDRYGRRYGWGMSCLRVCGRVILVYVRILKIICTIHVRAASKDARYICCSRHVSPSRRKRVIYSTLASARRRKLASKHSTIIITAFHGRRTRTCEGPSVGSRSGSHGNVTARRQARVYAIL